jgi:hypothetical protein
VTFSQPPPAVNSTPPDATSTTHVAPVAFTGHTNPAPQGAHPYPPLTRRHPTLHHPPAVNSTQPPPP